MKLSLLPTCLLFTLFTGLACSDKNAAASGSTDAGKTIGNKPPSMENKIKITIGTSTFTATLYDNPTAAKFKSMLPLTINMVELNKNEKYADLTSELPTNASNPGTI